MKFLLSGDELAHAAAEYISRTRGISIKAGSARWTVATLSPKEVVVTIEIPDEQLHYPGPGQ